MLKPSKTYATFFPAYSTRLSLLNSSWIKQDKNGIGTLNIVLMQGTCFQLRIRHNNAASQSSVNTSIVGCALDITRI